MTDMTRTREEVAKFSATANAVLRNAVLRAVLPGGSYPVDCSPERQAELLEPYEYALETDLVQLTEIIRCAYLQGVISVHRDLSGQPGVDQEMLDEQVEHYTNRTGDGEPVKL